MSLKKSLYSLAEISDVLFSKAYKKAIENKTTEISSREYNDFFRLNDYMKSNQKIEKIQKLKNLFISDKEFKKIIDQVANSQLKGGNNGQ